MLAHYGVDVLDPRTSLRRVWVLLQRLPPGTWPQADSPLSWSNEAHLLAALIDQVAALTWVSIRAAGGKAPQPKPVPRPTPRRRPPAHVAPAARAGASRPGRSGWAALAAELTGQDGVIVHHGR